MSAPVPTNSATVDWARMVTNIRQLRGAACMPTRMATFWCGCLWELGVGFQRCEQHTHWKTKVTTHER